MAIGLLVLRLLVVLGPQSRAAADDPASQGTQNPPDQAEAQPNASAEPAPPREEAPSIVEDLRGRVTDRTAIPAWKPTDPPEEAKAYCQALIAAHQTSAQAFANSARHDVTFVHLFEEPEKYRGQVVHFEGRVVRVRRLDPPGYVKGDVFGINDLYEAWIFDPEIHGANPVCLVFTQLPAGVPVKEKMEIPVAFDAYFFKRYRYQAKDGIRDCPLFIGHTLTVRKVNTAAAPDQAISAFTKNLVIAVLTLFVVTVGLAVWLSWWYRRGDRRIHTLVAGVNPPVFAEPEAPAEPDDADRPRENGSANGEEAGGYPDLPNRLRRGSML